MADKKQTTQLSSAFTLIDSSWQDYLKRVPLLTPIVLPPILYYLILDTFSYLAEHGTPGQPLVLLAQFMASSIFLSLPFYLFAIILQTFSTAALLSVLINPKINSVSAAYQEGAKKIVYLWWVSILTFLLVGGGFFLFIIPALIFSIWFNFSQYILFKEGKKGMHALLQSREYVRGYFWQVAGRVLFIVLIAAALGSISGYISTIFNNGLLALISQSFISLITVPLAVMYQYKLYENIHSVNTDITYKTKPWWLYLIASLVPFIAIITIGSILYLMKPFMVPDNSMRPAYEQGARLVMGNFPGVSGETAYVIYRKEGKLVIRRVMASSGEKLVRKGNTVSVLPKEKNETMYSHKADYSGAFFSPAFPLADGKEIIVGPNDIYVTTENVPAVTQTWEKITIDKIQGVPLFCYWKCTGSK